MKKTSSIAAQCLFVVMFTVVSVLGLSSIVELNILKQREMRMLQERGELTTARIADALSYTLWNLNRKEIERIVLDEIGSIDVAQIRVFDEKGALYVGKVKAANGAIKEIDANTSNAATVGPLPPYTFSKDINYNGKIGSVTLEVTDAHLQSELAKLKLGIAIKLLLLVVLLSVVLLVALRVLVVKPLSALTSWTERLPAEKAPIPPRFKNSGEINSLAEAFSNMSLNLKEKNEALRALSARLHSAQEEEGTRIARQIHDELGGALTGLKWDLERIDKTLNTANNGSRLSEVRKRIGTMTNLIETTINTVRRIASELRPGVLDDLGLVAAIEWQVQQFQSRTGLKCHLNNHANEVELNRERATAVFRILQEILTNVLRHARATNLYVKLCETKHHFELEVKDDGRGITESQRINSRSLGLLGMKERALLVGGEVHITGEEGVGTTVVVRVPLGA